MSWKKIDFIVPMKNILGGLLLFKTTCNIRSQASNTNLWLCALWTPPPSLSYTQTHRHK